MSLLAQNDFNTSKPVTFILFVTLISLNKFHVQCSQNVFQQWNSFVFTQKDYHKSLDKLSLDFQ